jgi:hypothetical protein
VELMSIKLTETIKNKSEKCVHHCSTPSTLIKLTMPQSWRVMLIQYAQPLHLQTKYISFYDNKNNVVINLIHERNVADEETQQILTSKLPQSC